MNHFSYQKKASIRKISLKLNTEIDYLKYKHDFITHGIKLIKTSNIQQGKSSHSNPPFLKQSSPKKGTIPFYFHKKDVPKNVDHLPNDIETDFFRPQKMHD